MYCISRFSFLHYIILRNSRHRMLLQRNLTSSTRKIGYEKVTLMINGGAWSIPDYLVVDSINGMKVAAKIGYSILTTGSGSSLDAVEMTIRSLEDDPVFNAGKGADLNRAGYVELDASIMEGKHLNVGCVAAVQNIQNPVTLARLIMEKTDHVLLAGHGASLFAKEMNIPEIPNEELVTLTAITKWKKFKKLSEAKNLANNGTTEQKKGHDTVGAVAIDRDGNVACAASTGGYRWKRVGRVGDSSTIGCGAYCDNNIGTVCTTGHGENIMKVMLARLVLQYMEQGMPPQIASENALQFMNQRIPGAKGGVIVLDNKGNVGKYFNTQRMPWATISNGELKYGIEPEDNFVEKLETYECIA